MYSIFLFQNTGKKNEGSSFHQKFKGKDIGEKENTDQEKFGSHNFLLSSERSKHDKLNFRLGTN